MLIASMLARTTNGCRNAWQWSWRLTQYPPRPLLVPNRAAWPLITRTWFSKISLAPLLATPEAKIRIPLGCAFSCAITLPGLLSLAKSSVKRKMGPLSYSWEFIKKNDIHLVTYRPVSQLYVTWEIKSCNIMRKKMHSLKTMHELYFDILREKIFHFMRN